MLSTSEEVVVSSEASCSVIDVAAETNSVDMETEPSSCVASNDAESEVSLSCDMLFISEERIMGSEVTYPASVLDAAAGTDSTDPSLCVSSSGRESSCSFNVLSTSEEKLVCSGVICSAEDVADETDPSDRLSTESSPCVASSDVEREVSCSSDLPIASEEKIVGSEDVCCASAEDAEAEVDSADVAAESSPRVASSDVGEEVSCSSVVLSTFKEEITSSEAICNGSVLDVTADADSADS